MVQRMQTKKVFLGTFIVLYYDPQRKRLNKAFSIVSFSFYFDPVHFPLNISPPNTVGKIAPLTDGDARGPGEKLSRIAY